MRKLVGLFAVAVLLLIVAAPLARAGPATTEDQIVAATTANLTGEEEAGVVALSPATDAKFGGRGRTLQGNVLIADYAGYERVLVAKAPTRSTKWPMVAAIADHSGSRTVPIAISVRV